MPQHFRTAAASLALALCAGAAAAQQAAAPAQRPGPCEDFHAHANAAWLEAAGEAEVGGAFERMQAQSRQRQFALLDAAAAAPDGEAGRVLGSFWAAALDTAAAEAAGTGALAPLLARIDKARKPRDLAEVLAQAHLAGVPLLFRFGVGSDLENPRQRVVYLRQGGLGLPDRDYYLREDPLTRSIRDQYRAYAARLLVLAGADATQAQERAERIVELETRLARASLSVAQLREPSNSYRMVKVADAARLHPRLELKRFFRTQDLQTDGAVSLAHTAFFTEADALLESLPVATWQAYLRFHLLHALAPHLAEPFRIAHWELFEHTLRGAEARPARREAALAAVDHLLGDVLGLQYAARHLDPATREGAEAIARALATQLDARLAAAAWLSEPARAAGRAKLAELSIEVGASAPAIELDGLALERDDHAGNVLAVARWRQRQALALLEADAPPALHGHRVNAWYDPVHNRLAVAAAFLQPPVYAPGRDAATDYGTLGALLGHELSHGFDVQGSKIDARGRMQPWWSPADYQAFVARTQPLAAQYDAYTAVARLKVDGRRTFLENLADLGGLELAYGAFARSGALTGPELGGHTPAQRFFLAWAELWRRRYARDELAAALVTDVHAPSAFRVNGPLANLPEFAGAFSCRPGEGLVRADAARVRMWN